MIDRFNGFALWARFVIGICVLVLAIFISVRAVQAVKMFVFGNVEAKRERAEGVVVEEQGTATKETAAEASRATVERYERHITVDRTVRESQDAVTKAYKGGNIDPGVDAAGADGLCKLHDDLCRREQR